MISSIIVGLMLCGVILFIVYKSMTYNPDFDRIQERERMNGNKGKKFITRSCSEAVPMSISRARTGMNDTDPSYRFDYTVEY